MDSTPERALEAYRTMEVVARQAGSAELAGAALIDQAKLHDSLKQWAEAERFYQKAIVELEAAKLPAALGEAESAFATSCLRRLDYGGAQVPAGGRAILNEDVTRMAILAARATLVQVATFGELLDRSPMQSRLFTRQTPGEAAVTWQDLAEWEPHADLVVFSGLRDRVASHGNGRALLSWLLLGTGVRSVVVSAWHAEVPPEASVVVALSRETLGAAANDRRMHAASAPRASILRLLETRRYAHPHYWANLHVFSR